MCFSSNVRLWHGFAAMAYKLRSMDRVRLLAALLLTASVAACAPELGPPPPGGYPRAMPGEPVFRPSEFAWSQAPGGNAIIGRLTYAHDGTHYGCQGASVILTPETPWSRRRMEVLYLSADRAALPADEVRARTPEAPPGDSSPYIKRAVCDADGRFSFAHLPAGAWYVITIAKPVGGGGNLAIMKRVVTRGGKPTYVTF
jgi:hypothetical protein